MMQFVNVAVARIYILIAPVNPILLILECEATQVAVSLNKKITYIAPAYAAVITWQYWQ